MEVYDVWQCFGESVGDPLFSIFSSFELIWLNSLCLLINDLLSPTSGEVLVNGKKPGVESKMSISFLPERTYLNKSLTVKQVFNYFIDFYNDFRKS